MSKKTTSRVLKVSAITLDIGAPLTATLAQFPVWIDKSAGATVSGIFIVMAFLCCIPFYKVIFSWLKSPSMPLLWSIIFVVLFALSQIIDQMLVVCIVGMISNLAGAGLYKAGKSLGETDDG